MDKVALVIGHNNKQGGAYSTVLGREFDYWKRIALGIQKQIPEMVDVYERQYAGGYSKEMRNMLYSLNQKQYEYCLELHFNAGTSTSTGSYSLVYYKNMKARDLSTNLLSRIQNEYGINPIKLKSLGEIHTGLYLVNSDDVKGGYGICHSKPTYILVEPFFGSNPNEAVKFMDERQVADVFINFIKEV